VEPLRWSWRQDGGSRRYLDSDFWDGELAAQPGELFSAFGVSLLSLLMPLLGFIFFIGLALLAFAVYRRRCLRKRKRTHQPV
jgi:hypothetical protein